MPHHERHKQQRVKNLVMLAILVAFIAVVYYMTILKFGQ